MNPNKLLSLQKSRSTTRDFEPKFYPNNFKLLRALKHVEYAPWSCNLWNIKVYEIPDDYKAQISPKVVKCPRAFAIYIDKSIKSAREADAQSLGSAIAHFQLAAKTRGLDTFWMCGISGDAILRKCFRLKKTMQLACVLGVGVAKANNSDERKKNVDVRDILIGDGPLNYISNIKKVYADRNATFIVDEEAFKVIDKLGPYSEVLGNIDIKIKNKLTFNPAGKKLYFFVIADKPDNVVSVLPNILTIRGLVTELLLALRIWNFYDTPFYKMGYTGRSFKQFLFRRSTVRHRNKKIEIITYD